MGVKEIVEEILNEFPVAIHDEDADKKNVVLLAVENRQPKIYKLLRKKYHKSHESVFQKVDKNGNSAIHLAATFGKNRPWRISSAAIQMQWDLKWYNVCSLSLSLSLKWGCVSSYEMSAFEMVIIMRTITNAEILLKAWIMGKSQFIKSSTPPNLWTLRNGEDKTSMEVFEETHEGIKKDGVQWLNSTSQSCSVVAARIASVAYASAATVPGGYKGDSGIPILEGDPSFDTFIIASLVALCFSLTSLTMFLSVLTSNYMIEDFLYNLPTKLLLGLTSLFISIGAMLVSFCAGHFFNIEDRNRNTGSRVFAIICLPVSAYALTQFRLLIRLVNAPF
ncbi:serine/threonine-protein phosphatase 6 regulatory ankyrin repeat subunit B-like protein [Cinnamomum micranthum f. kanehirae]|uniref:Serine/threonine-protein phosphatase 6 regulatory ankyrin repeat subunit B-like protein n=1 Tax=Cinnamomum micranthum f. kanehirae TaxID=337451 RepID=A0A3S4NDA9_9MAGN|nr:serine/threonine-protein phosphatase 6 regulatory ankyrin repeat subunit B-like protein [Cinnamomum micranthum f. kanehirae]